MQTLIFNKSNKDFLLNMGGVSDCLVFNELTSDNNEDCRPESSQWGPGGIFFVSRGPVGRTPYHHPQQGQHQR